MESTSPKGDASAEANLNNSEDSFTVREAKMLEAIARIMKLERKRAGLTQNAVAQALGISQGGLSKIESGKLVPSAQQWFAFCLLVGIPPGCIVPGREASDSSEGI